MPQAAVIILTVASELVDHLKSFTSVSSNYSKRLLLESQIIRSIEWLRR